MGLQVYLFSFLQARGQVLQGEEFYALYTQNVIPVRGSGGTIEIAEGEKSCVSLFSRSTSGINLNRKYIPPAMKLDNL
jgi:hypothetical protein